MNGHVYIYRQGDQEIILNYIKNFKTLSNEELLAKAAEFSNNDFFGVHQQGLYFIALWRECKDRGLESPLKVQDNFLLIQEVKEVSEKPTMMDILQSKGVKLVRKTGSFIMPMSAELAKRWKTKPKDDV